NALSLLGNASPAGAKATIVRVATRRMKGAARRDLRKYREVRRVDLSSVATGGPQLEQDHAQPQQTAEAERRAPAGPAAQSGSPAGAAGRPQPPAGRDGPPRGRPVQQRLLTGRKQGAPLGGPWSPRTRTGTRTTP